jgi:hypothetical protein
LLLLAIGQKGCPMLDAMMIALGLACCAFLVGYVALCDRL